MSLLWQERRAFRLQCDYKPIARITNTENMNPNTGRKADAV